MKTMMVLFALMMGGSFSAFAAVPKKLDVKPKAKLKLSQGDINQAIVALRLPLKNRIAALKKQGMTGFRSLERIMYDKQQTLQARWRAIISLGIISPRLAQKNLVKAVKSRQWFMRNAGLLAMTHGDRTTALRWAQKLLSDKALVVRTAAVQVINKLNGREHRDLLWSKLYNQENYRKNQSLWVRKHIAQALAKFAKRGDEKRMIQILQDRDPRLHPAGIKGLEAIHGQRLQVNGTGIENKRLAWINWWEKTKN